MDQRLNDAAQDDNIEELYALIKQDPFVLENIDKVPFSHTPLHEAILAGQTRFAKEVASLKPSFAGKLNQDGLSPMHMATITGQVEMVKEFLTINPTLCILKGKEKRIPLHCAAVAGTVTAMEKLLWHCPESILEFTIRNETAIHLAVKNNQYEAFNMLLEWLQEISLKDIKYKSLRAMVGKIKLLNKDDFSLKKNEVEGLQHIIGTLRKIRKEEVLNQKDDEGNTVLHLATFGKQCQMIKEMIGQDSINRPMVNVNATNARDHTALDVLLQLPRDEQRDEIEKILRQAGAITTNEVINLLPPSTPNPPMRESIRVLQKLHHTRKLMDYLAFQADKVVSPSEVRNVLLVLAVLIATGTFQAGISPPSGISQDINIPNCSNATDNTTSSLEMLKKKGFAVIGMWHGNFWYFLLSNMMGFLFSINMIFLLTRGFPLENHLRVALVSMVGTYVCSILSITPPELIILVYVVLVGTGIFFVSFDLYISYKSQTSIN